MEYLEIGVIVKTHGLKGDVIVKSLTDQKGSWLEAGQTLFLEDEITTLTIKEAKPHKKDFLVSFDGVQSINDVLRYLKEYLYIPKSSLEPLQDNEYYFDDLIGMVAHFSNGQTGIIKDVLRLPHGEILEIEIENKVVKIPFVDAWVREVNLEKKEMIINELEGFL